MILYSIFHGENDDLKHNSQTGGPEMAKNDPKLMVHSLYVPQQRECLHLQCSVYIYEYNIKLSTLITQLILFFYYNQTKIN